MRGKKEKIGQVLVSPIKAGAKSGTISDARPSRSTDSNTKILMDIAKNTKDILNAILNKPQYISASNISTSAIMNDVAYNNLKAVSKKSKSSIINKKSMLNESSSSGDDRPLSSYLDEIISLLSKISEGGGGKKQKAAAKSVIPKGSVKEISAVNSAVSKLSELSSKSIGAITRMINALKSLGKKSTTKTIQAGAAAVSAITKSFQALSSTSTAAVKNIRTLMKQFTILLLLTTSPLFVKGADYLKNFFESLKGGQKDGDKSAKAATDYKYLFYSIAIGIGAIVGSLILLTAVPWQSVVALLAFLTALAAIVYLFTRNQRGSSINKVNTITTTNNKQSFTGINPIATIAFSIALLVLAIAAIEDIDWKQALILVGFIGAITAIVTVASKFNKPGSNTGVLGFAFGIGILLIAVHAVEEVFGKDGNKFDINNPSTWSAGPFLLIAFMFLIARVTFFGGTVKGVLGFAFGVAVLTLAIWGVNEMIDAYGPGRVILSAAIISGVTIALGFALWLAGGGKYRNNMMGKEVVTGPVKKTSVLEFIGLIVIMTASIWVLSKIDNPEKLLYNALIMTGTIYAVVFGISLLNKLMKDANPATMLKQVAAVSGIIIIGAASMYLLSTIKDTNTLLANAAIMMGSIVLVGLGIFLLGKIPKAELMTGIIGIGAVTGVILIASISMKLIASIQDSDKLLLNAGIMMGSIAIVALGIVAIGAIVSTGIGGLMIAAGVGIMVAIVGIMYVGSKAMKIVGETKISEAQAQLYANNLKTVVGGVIDSMSVTDALKMAVKSPGMIVAFSLMMLAASTMRNIAAIQISEAQAESFVNNFRTFAKSFAEVLKDSTITDALKSAEEGVDGLSEMMKLAKTLVDVLLALSNSTIKEYKVENGQQVLKSVTPFDITKLSSTAGANLAALVKGFVDSFKGMEVMARKERKNMKKTMESMSGFTEVFSSLGQLLQSADVLADTKKVMGVRTGLTLLTNTILFINAALVKGNVKAQHFDGFRSFFDILNKVDWDKTARGTERLQKNVEKMVKNINAIQLNKVIALKDTMTLFTDMKMKQETSDNIERIITLITKLSEQQGGLVLSQDGINEAVQNISKSIGDKSKMEENKSKAVTNETLLAAVEYLSTLLNGMDVNVTNSSISVEVENRVKVVNDPFGT